MIWLTSLANSQLEDSADDETLDLIVNPDFSSPFPAKEKEAEKPTSASARTILCTKEVFMTIYLIQVYGIVSLPQNFTPTFLQKIP